VVKWTKKYKKHRFSNKFNQNKSQLFIQKFFTNNINKFIKNIPVTLFGLKSKFK